MLLGMTGSEEYALNMASYTPPPTTCHHFRGGCLSGDFNESLHHTGHTPTDLFKRVDTFGSRRAPSASVRIEAINMIPTDCSTQAIWRV